MTKTTETKRPLWRDEKDGMIAEAHFDADTQEYIIHVTKGDMGSVDRIPCMYLPRFGIDVADMEAILTKAEEMAQIIENGV